MTVKMTSPFTSGFGLQNGDALNAALLLSAEAGIIATGTTQATAYQLRASVNVVATAAASTGVKLPPPTPALHVVVFNDGASTLQVYGYSSDTIDGTAGATGVALTNARRAEFYCTDVGKWESALLGAVSS